MRDEVIVGFNKYVTDLQADKANTYLFTLTKFDTTKQEVVVDRVPIAEVPLLTRETYRPGASTPLYDALANSIRRIPSGAANNILTVVYTDGEENASHEWTLENLNRLIKDEEAKGHTFMYLGAAMAAWANEKVYSGAMSAANVIRARGNRGSTKTAFMHASTSTMTYASNNGQLRAIVTDDQKEDVLKSGDSAS